MIRPSGTEPKIRITVEARDKKRMEEIWNKITKIVRRSIK